MKRFLTNLCLLFICVILLAPFSNRVNAQDDPLASKYVYYQAIVQDGAAIQATSQYYYTVTNNLGETDAKSEHLPIASRGNKEFENLYSDADENSRTLICEKFATTLNKYCKEDSGVKELSTQPLASLRMNARGDITFDIANDYTLQYLEIRYILANEIGSENLFCNGNNICAGAKNIQPNGVGITNWTNKSQSGEMLFYNSTIEQKFTLAETPAGKIYRGYNVFDDMLQSKEKLAKASGAYVITTFAIKKITEDDTGRVYKMNYEVNSKSFDTVGNDSKSKQHSVLISNALTDTDDNESVKKVSSYAALVKPNDSKDGSAGAKAVGDFFETTLRPILIVAVGVLFIVVGTHTGVTIVKSSDEPEVRSDAIKKLIGMFIGAFIIAAILIFYKDIIEIVQGYF